MPKTCLEILGYCEYLFKTLSIPYYSLVFTEKCFNLAELQY